MRKINFDAIELVINLIIFGVIIIIQLLGSFISKIGDWVNANLMGTLTAINR